MSEPTKEQSAMPAITTAPAPAHMPQAAAQAQQSPAPGLVGGPPQPSHPQYPYAQPQYVTQPRIIPYDKTWDLAKLALRAASLVFCVILLGISIAISIGPGYDSWNITIYWVGPLAGVAGIWDLAELITILACGKRHGAEHRRGIHPGAHVGVELCIWLAGIFCIFLSILSYFSARSDWSQCQDDSSSSYRYSYYSCDDDEYAILYNGTVIPCLRAIEAFIALLTLVHFILFVRGCIETNQRNRTRSQYMMMPPPQMYYAPQPGMAPYGYPMMPQAYMSAPQNAILNEKSPAAATQPQDNQSNLAGFYAPMGFAAPNAPPPQAAPKETAVASGST